MYTHVTLTGEHGNVWVCHIPWLPVEGSPDHYSMLKNREWPWEETSVGGFHKARCSGWDMCTLSQYIYRMYSTQHNVYILVVDLSI